MKDDSGSYAVVAEQGSSASRMAAAKVMDVIVRQPDCAGQAADPVSANTQVKNGGRSKSAPKFRSKNVQVSGYVFHDTSA